MTTCVQTSEGVSQAIREWGSAPILGLDTETRGLDWWRDPMVGISVATHTKSWYFPFRHATGNLDPKHILQLRDAIEGRLVVGANLNFDWHVLRRDGWLEGAYLPPVYHDASIASYALNENVMTKIENLAKIYLGVTGENEEAKLKQAIGDHLGIKKVTKKHKAEMWKLPPNLVADYAGIDAQHAVLLLDKLIPLLKADGTWNTYLNLVEYQRCLHRMEENGLPVIREHLEVHWKEAREKRDELKEAICKASEGQVDNPRSSKQLCAWMGLESTKKEVLETIPDDPRVYLIQDFRKYDKACSTYFKAIDHACGDSALLHPSLKLTGAVVRLSAERPNTQAIPRDTSEYYKVKPSFGYTEGDRLIVEADLTQAEIAMAAHFTQDPVLLDAVRHGVDMHSRLCDTVKEMFDIDIPRQIGKLANFMIQYGCGAEKLANALRIPLALSRKLLAAHKKMFAQMHACAAAVSREFRSQRRIRLWSGRTRHWSYDAKEHAAFNNKIQGSVSEQMRVAIVRMTHELPEFKQGLTVHDSTIGTCEAKLYPELAPEIHRIMTDWPWMDPCTDCDIAAALTWDKCKDKENEWKKPA